MEIENEKLMIYDDPDAIAGIIQKVASVSPLECTSEDLSKINKYTLTPLKAEDIFIFKAVMADNEQDDRNNMPFDLKALQDMKKLYLGKTVLKDHERLADNQIARIYDTDLIQNANKITELGEVHTELIAKIYMIKTASNADLIKEIQGGIKKEVSTSCMPSKMICNICGTDNLTNWCKHYPSREYDVTDSNGKTSKKKCKMLLSGIKDAYELSLVAVPAQPRASTMKSFGFTKPVKPEESKTIVEEINTKNEEMNIRLSNTRLKAMMSFYNANESQEREENTNE